MELPQVYAGPLANGDVVAVIVNWRASMYGRYSFELSKIGIEGRVRGRDLWSGEDIGTFQKQFVVENIPWYGNYAIRFTQDI